MQTVSTRVKPPVILSAFGIARVLLLILTVLLCLHLAGVVLEGGLLYDSRLTRLVVRYFNFNGEENVPAFFSSLLLTFAAVMLYVIYHLHESWKRSSDNKYWLLLSLVFIFMAIDESVQLHEHIAEFVRPSLKMI